VSALRVVHVVETLGLGGLERTVQALVRHAGPPRLRPEVVCATADGPLAAEIERLGAPVHVLGLRDYYPRSIAVLARLLGRLRAEVVHCHGFFAGVLGRAAGWWCGARVMVHHLHTADPTLRRRHRRLERLLARCTARIVCCSEAVASDASQRLGLPAGLLIVVPNGIDPPPAADREAARRTLGRPAEPVLGCVGALAPHKGQAVLLEALGRLPASLPAGTVVLVGDGPERADLERRAAGARPWRVVFAGARPEARLLLPAFDAAVAPSLREGLGLAVLEAMDAGLPVVASRVGGLPEVVEDGRTGLLAAPGDPEDLARALARLLAMPDRGRGLGLRGRQRVEARFRAGQMALRIQSIYEEALGERRAA
jgi:glycosyltransferase involved in cell wall biosynthesis